MSPALFRCHVFGVNPEKFAKWVAESVMGLVARRHYLVNKCPTSLSFTDTIAGDWERCSPVENEVGNLDQKVSRMEPFDNSLTVVNLEVRLTDRRLNCDLV